MSTYPPNHSTFETLYQSDVGVSAPHNAALGISLPPLTSIPLGAVDMRGANGLDVIFYGTGNADTKLKYEILYYYRASKGSAGGSDVDAIYLPFLVYTSNVDNLLGDEVGLAGGYVSDAYKFVDTLLSLTVAYHGTGLQSAHYGTTVGAATPELVVESSGAAESIAMLHLRKITAEWVRIHIYEGAATSYTTANALVKRLYE